MQLPDASQAPRRWPRVIGLTIALAVACAVVAPLLVPVPPLEDTVPYRQLAGPESEWLDLGGVDTHMIRSGEATCGVVLLHGFGASVFTWRDVLPAASERCAVVAYDRPGFGITERPLRGDWSSADQNPYSLTRQADVVPELMDKTGMDTAVLVGHSAGAAVAVLAADRHPERITGLVLISPAVMESRPFPDWLVPLFRSPQMRRIGPWASRVLGGEVGRNTLRESFYDPEFVTDDLLAGYEIATRAEDWDRALWEFTIAPRPDDPADSLDEIDVPALVIAGESDTIVPFEDSRAVAEALDARFVGFEETGHVAHEERFERFMTELYRFLDDIEPACEGCE